MQIVEQSVEILQMTAEPLLLIERAGRTCYKSEGRISEDSSIPFVQGIIARGHESVLEHASATVRFVCDRGVTHEMVRHRIASYSQESTRYCNYGSMDIHFIRPVDFDLCPEDLYILGAIENHYNWCLSRGRTPQQARYFLPNGLKTEIVMTANFREWRYFLRLRTDKAAHPQMRALARELHRQLSSKVEVIFQEYTWCKK